MPNHFHLMVLVRETELPVASSVVSGGATALRDSSDDWESSDESRKQQRSFINSIAIMLRSYTRAINKQGFSGSLFRPHTKAECVNCPNGITPSFITQEGITHINIAHLEKQYPQVCFNYIHQNPVKAGLVKKATDWEFSSAKDYAGLRAGKLVNKKLTQEYLLLARRKSGGATTSRTPTPTLTNHLIAQITRGKLYGKGETLISSILIDSRSLVLQKNVLFAAIKGVRNDGHHYIRQLFDKGVRNFLVDGRIYSR